MQLQLQVENVKCGGCARSIEKALTADSRISRVSVDAGQGLVVIEAEGDVRAHAAAAAKSFVSCAVARMG